MIENIISKTYNLNILLQIQGDILTRLEQASFGAQTNDLEGLNLFKSEVNTIYEQLQTLTGVQLDLIARIEELVDDIEEMPSR